THDIQHISTSNTNPINTASIPLSIAVPSRAFNNGALSYPDPSKYDLPDDHSMPHLEDIYASPSKRIFTDSSYDDEGVICLLERKQLRLNRSMIGSLMYLTASRLDIMFAVFACSRFQVTPKTSHLQAMKRIFSKELASPKQMALGKDISNLLMDVRLPKTTLPTRFVQLLIDHQLGDMSHHKDIYANPSLTKKVFSYMKRVGASFSGVVNALFDNMLVPTAEEVGLIQDDVQAVPIPTEPSTSKPHKKHKSKKQQPKVPSLEPSHEHKLSSPSNDPLPGELESKVIDIKSTSKEKIEKLEGRVAKLEEENRAQAKLYKIHLKHPEKVLSMQVVDEEEPAKVEEVVKAAKLMTEVVTTVGATTTADAPKVSVLRKRRGVIIQDPEETTSTIVMNSKGQSKDKEKGILIKEPKPLKGKAQIKQDEAFTRQQEAELNADINWNAIIDQVKRSERLNDAVMKYQALKRKPLTEAQARKNIIIYLKNMAGFKMNYFKGMTYKKEIEVEAHKREGKSLEKEISKKQKMDEEAKELRSHLQIVPNDDDDDVYTEATPLASKIPIVDYKIQFERNKTYFKIIREDVYEEIKRRYPLTHFTLEQMLNNVRLEVKEESEMSLELLRLVRRKLNEGYVPA
nr:putative mitochondrial protein [Tanacetum cinerariifolium]